MAYATVADVQQQNVVRPLSATSRPNTDQVVDWLEQTGAVVDGILRSNGYALPVPTTATQALKLLEHYNAIGAAAMVERGAPTSDRREEADALWAEAQKMLQEEIIILDIPVDVETAGVGVGPVATPYFTRDMEL